MAFESQFEPRVRMNAKSSIEKQTETWLQYNTIAGSASSGGSLRGIGDGPPPIGGDPEDFGGTGDPTVPIGNAIGLTSILIAGYGYLQQRKRKNT